MNKTIVAVLAVIIIGGVAGYVFRKPHPSPLPAPVVQDSQAVTPSSNSVPAASSPTVTPLAAKASTAAKDCGSDMHCFIAEAPTCTPATVEFSTVLLKSEDGELRITDRYNIVGPLKSGLCSFNTRIDDASVTSTTMPNSAQVQAGNQGAKALIGSREECSVPGSVLASVLTNWSQDTFSSSDFHSYSCFNISPDGQKTAVSN